MILGEHQYTLDTIFNDLPTNSTIYPTLSMHPLGYAVVTLVILGLIIAFVSAAAIYTAFRDRLKNQLDNYVEKFQKRTHSTEETQNDEEVTISFVSSETH